MKKRLGMFLFCFALVVTNGFAANILVNPGFEAGVLAPWFNSNDFCGGCLWGVTGTDANTGSFSAMVSGNRLLEQDFTATQAGLISEASLWLKMPDTGIAAIYFLYGDGTTDENIVNVPAVWTKFDVTSFLDPGKTLAGFGVYGCSGCGGASATFADDFVVDTAVPEPATFLLFAFGALGLGAAKRFLRN